MINFAFVRSLAHGGLALGTTLASVIGLALGLYALRRRLGAALPLRDLLVSIAKIGVASLLMGICIAYIYPWSEQWFFEGQALGELLRLGMAVVIGIVVYGILTWVLRVPEVQAMYGTARGLVLKVVKAE